MAGRRTNLALLGGLTIALVATGAIAFGIGTGAVIVATVAHGVLALAMLLLTHWKWRMVRRGLAQRPAASTWPSVLLGVVVVITVASGLLHASGIATRLGPFAGLQVHVVGGLLAVPLTAWHVVARNTLPAPHDMTRRNVLRAGLLLGSAGAAYALLETAYHATGLPGARRRASGSFEDGSHRPREMPSIIWLTDPRLELSAADWSLTVVDATGRHDLRFDDIATADDRVTAVIDCTVGWWAEQDWEGVALPRLVTPGTGTRSLLVRSATGYTRRFPVGDLDHLLLATRYEGRPLAGRHGFPARLVAPGRRGFWWVKWVTHVETSDRPWWWQSSYPLQ